MKPELITVVESASFVTDAKGCMTDDERTEAINMIAANPECGDVVTGGGGIRKVRFAIGGRGKRWRTDNLLFSQRTGSSISFGSVRQKRSVKFNSGRNEYAGQCGENAGPKIWGVKYGTDSI
jgi:hypothetical protein